MKVLINQARLETALTYCVKRQYTSRTMQGRKFWLALYQGITGKYYSLLRGETV